MAEDNGASKTEQTPKGLTVPIPTRGEFFANLRKVAKVRECSAPTPASDREGEGFEQPEDRLQHGG